MFKTGKITLTFPLRALAIVFFLPAFLAGLGAPAFALDTVPVAYTANTAMNTVSVIDLRDNTVFATVYDVDSPTAVAISPDGKWLYVANGEANNVTYVNMSSFRITGTIPVGNLPSGIAMAPDGGTVYVANYLDDTVSIINTTKKKVNSTIHVGAGPYGVKVNPVNGEAYVINSDEGTISVIRDRGVVATITAGDHTTKGLAVTPDGSRLLVANKNNNTVSIINTTTYRAINTVNVGASPAGIAVSPNGWYAFITNPGSRNISDMLLSDSSIRVSFNVENASDIGFSPDGLTAYVITTPAGNVKAMDSAAGEVKATIGVRAADMEIATVDSELMADTVPPETSLNLYGQKDAGGAYVGEVICNITAVDYPSGTGLKNSWYSFDGLTWIPYQGNFTLTTPTNITVYYYSTDKAGNTEWSKSKVVSIISKPAAASPSPTPAILPANDSIRASPGASTPTASPEASGTPKPSGGFEAMLAMMAVSGIGYLVRKK